MATFLKTRDAHWGRKLGSDWGAVGTPITDKEAIGLTSTKAERQPHEGGASVDVVAIVVRVSDLGRSLLFYSDVFSCRVAVREKDMALLLTPQGFEIYLHQNDEFHTCAAGARGVHHLMWATDSQSDMQRNTDRLRAYDAAVYSYAVEGMMILEGTDPDGFRVIVAYPTPRRLPRTAIVERLRG
jgi:extradiol dioxygenase family protein